MQREWTVDAAEEGERLDRFLAARAEISRGAARRTIEDGRVRVGGRRGAKGTLLHAGDRVTALGPLPDAAALRPAPEPDAPLDVLFFDERAVAVNKPAGVATHPLRPGEGGTLAGALVARFPECADAGADPREAGFAQRLDVDTSGVIVAARSRAAWELLRAAFRDGRVAKTYLALVAGEVSAAGEIALPLAHDPQDRRRVIGVEDPDRAARLEARPARTRFRPLARAAGVTLLEVATATGRMHQVRAHLAAAGHPLVGDALYGGPPALDGTPGHFLHAWRLTVADPPLDVTAPLPADRAAALARLGIRAS